jgi:hypothetical protein
MKDTIYFRHDFNANQDIKIKAMRRSFGWEGYGWYWYIIETMRAEEGGMLPMVDIAGVLADDLRVDEERVKEYLNLCIKLELFKHANGKLYSERLVADIKHMHDARIKNQENGKKGGRPVTQPKPKNNPPVNPKEPTANPEITQTKPNQKANSIGEYSKGKESINKTGEDTIVDRAKYMNEDGMPICDMVQRRMFCEDSGKYVGIEVIPDHAIVTVQKPGQPEMNMARVSLTMGDWDYITKLRMP